MANNFFLDLLFPKQCVSCGRFGSYICADCFAKVEFIEKPICPVCQRQAIGGRTHPRCAGRHRVDGLIIACHYRGPIKEAIQKIKYRGAYDIAKMLNDLLAGSLWKFDFPADATLVPIPLYGLRKRRRGFNQAQILADNMAKKFGQRLDDLLLRKVETRSQVGLSKKQRRENVRGVFEIDPKRKPFVQGKSFILVDDVYTSGATMQEAARVLKRAGAKNVWAMAIALG